MWDNMCITSRQGRPAAAPSSQSHRTAALAARAHQQPTTVPLSHAHGARSRSRGRRRSASTTATDARGAATPRTHAHTRARTHARAAALAAGFELLRAGGEVHVRAPVVTQRVLRARVVRQFGLFPQQGLRLAARNTVSHLRTAGGESASAGMSA